MKARKRDISKTKEITLRKHLNADALFKAMRTDFTRSPDHRSENVTHILVDSLMAGFAVFSLKDPSVLAFDGRRIDSAHNLKTIYGMGSIPCDTSIREILDGVDPNDLRPLFRDAFRQLQRGKVLEKFVLCKDVTYYLQTVGAAVVHHDLKEVIVLPPETIRKQDGETKMDCERNAVRRFLGKLRQDHPHLQFIVNEDGLSSNGPHIEDLEKHNLHYILGVKPGDHKFLFEYVDDAVAKGDVTELAITRQDKPHLTHCFSIVYDAPLNKSHQDKRVTFVEYR